MPVHEDWNAERCRLSVDDELTIYNAAALKPALLDPLQRAGALELDLSQVPELDAAGVQLLVLLKREGAAVGKNVSFSGHSPAVLKILDLCDLAGYFGDPLVIPSQPAA